MVYYEPKQDRNMKSILWVLNGCGLEGRGITGAPVRFHEVSKRFTAFGHLQHLMTTSGGKALLTSLGCKIPMSTVPASVVLKNEPCRQFRLWSYIVTSLLWRIGFRHPPTCDTIITVSDYFCDIIPAMGLKRKLGAKWIAWIHHCETDPKTRPGLRIINEITARMQKWSFKHIAKFADCAWINDTIAGDEIERRLVSFGMDPKRIRRMQNGIDLEAIKSTPPPKSKTADAVMIGVRPNKGLYDIIPIWERINRIRPEISLTLMGGMGGEAQVLQEITKRGLPIKPFKPEDGGFLSAPLYYAKIKEARILFAPSHEEGWGIAVCEAMAAGLPVVAYDLPAYKKIYGDAYISVPCFDMDAFANSVVEVLGDEKLFSEMQAKGFECAAKYDWDLIAKEDSFRL